MTVAHRLPYDPTLRAGARLSVDPVGRRHYGSAWARWMELFYAEADRGARVFAGLTGGAAA